MHISLDSALGRQRRLNSVGESVFQIAPDAAAGYSLRSLTGGDPSVVRVRRESDNGERDFRSSEINSGSMVRWVNEQITPPLDLRELTATGRDGPIIEAAAAYSLRNLSDSYTGNVVEVRRNSDGALKDFKASEVTDGTLEAWVNTSFADALPLDTAGAAAAAYSLRNLSSSYTGSVVEVRRSSDGNTAPFTATEVTDGTLEAWVAEEQVGWNVQPTWDVASGDGVITSQSKTATTSTFSITTTSGNSYVRQSSKPNHFIASSGDQVVANITLNGFDAAVSARLRTAGTNIVVAGQTLSNGTANYTFNLTGSGGYFSFSAVEATSGATLTFNSIKVIGKSGYVSKWYDQSGNDNHATQGTPASQPKIVSAGSLVTGGLDFNGTSDFFQASIGTLTQPISGFSVFKNNSLLNSPEIWDSISPTNRVVSYAVAFDDTFRISAGVAIPSASSSQVDGTTYLRSDLINTAASKGYVNGTLKMSGNAGTNSMEGLTIGARYDGSVNFTNGSIAEVIIYNSDQSDKRRAIEENIGSNYGITLTSSKDGTVSKWYDQSTTSGVPNANHAVQTDTASQPKIVSGGSLVSGGIDFDGVDDYLSSGAFPLTGTDDLSTFFVAAIDSSADLNPLISQSDGSGTGRTWLQSEAAGPVFESFIGGSSSQFGAIPVGAEFLASLIYNDSAGTLDVFRNGSQSGTQASSIAFEAANGGINIGSHKSFAIPFDGQIAEVIIYPTDQSDNRTALEANIGETYGIAGIPAYDNTVNGFVETWYDQSGNGNNATQLTAGSQPKIVSGGSLVTGGIDFDGVDDALFTALPVLGDTFSAFCAADASALTANLGIYSQHITGSANRFAFSESGAGNTYTFFKEPSALVTTTTISASCQLTTSIKSGTSVAIYVDGGADEGGSLASSTVLSAKFSIASANQGTAAFAPLLASEIIVYNTDQTANRPAIEANINNQYDIY